MSIENRLLSKVIDENSFATLVKFNIRETDFSDQKETYKYIKSYIEQFGEVPSYSEVVRECPSFEYVPEVADKVPYLCSKIKSDNAKRKAFELLQYQATQKFNDMDGKDFINWLYEETANIKGFANIELTSGTNFATNGAERLAMYEESRETRTYSFIKTPYDGLTDALGGGFELGDYVLLQAYTNVGKSWIASDIGLKAFNEGFGVIHYSPELSKKQQLQRLDTLNGHFTNSELRIGSLNERREEEYKRYLKDFESNETPYVVKTMGDLPKGLSLEVIEADLQSNENIKMVIIDGFNLMNHRGKDGNRNAMTNTSRRLRQLFAKYSVVGVVVHQIPTSAMKENQKDSGERQVVPAKLEQYSESIAMIQDASCVLNFDQYNGSGKMLLAKTRTPNVGKMFDFDIDFNNGRVKELDAMMKLQIEADALPF